MPEYKGFHYEVTPDETSYDSPRQDPTQHERHLGSMALFHKKYTLGDTDCVDKDGNPVTLSSAGEIEKNLADYVSLPVYGYDHGGMRIQTFPFGDRFDSGKLGIIYVSRAKIDKVMPALAGDDESVMEMLDEEVREYDRYLGEGYWQYSIDNPADPESPFSSIMYIGEDEAQRAAEERIDELVESGVSPEGPKADAAGAVLSLGAEPEEEVILEVDVRIEPAPMAIEIEVEENPDGTLNTDSLIKGMKGLADEFDMATREPKPTITTEEVADGCFIG